MKQMTKIFFILVVIGLTSCSPKIKSNMSNPHPKLSENEDIALLDINHNLPDNVVKVGEIRDQDAGASIHCKFDQLMKKARETARENGANIVKVIDKKKPNLWSTCYRLKIELYKYNGDVSTLPQYQLAKD